MKAFETLTVSDTAKALTQQIYSAHNGLETCTKATIMVETAPIRYRVDGSDPTASVGLLANAGDVLTLTGATELRLFRAIRSTAADATISVDYSSMMNTRQP